MQTFKIEKNDTQCVVTWRHFDLTVILLFIIFAGLTVIAAFFVYGVFVRHAFGAIPIALLFWGLWLFLLALIFDNLYGETTFVLDENGLDIIYTCLLFQNEKRIALDEIVCFEKEMSYHHKDRRKRRPTYLLRVACREDNIRKSFRLHTRKSKSFGLPSKEKFLSLPTFGKELEEEIDDLCEQLNAFLETLKQSCER